MLPRERVLAALAYKPVDMPPMQYQYMDAGLYEHGEKLQGLWLKYPEDFGSYDKAGGIPAPDPKDFDADGRYHRIADDAWGVTWEYRIFGVAGQTLRRPLDDWANLAAYKAPPVAPLEGQALADRRAAVADYTKTYFAGSGGASIFEVLHAVRSFEDVLIDLATGEPRVFQLIDLITDHYAAHVANAIAGGGDMFHIGDDYGTQQGLMISREMFNRVFRPRYERLIKPVKAAGQKVYFHSCGMVWDLLEDFRAMGVDAIWPQLPLYDEKELHAKCRDLGLAIALHPDRAHMMTYGTPKQIREAVHRIARNFEIDKGGAWFHIEIDNGFPWENARTLIETVGELRKQR